MYDIKLDDGNAMTIWNLNPRSQQYFEDRGLHVAVEESVGRSEKGAEVWHDQGLEIELEKEGNIGREQTLERCKTDPTDPNLGDFAWYSVVWSGPRFNYGHGHSHGQCHGHGQCLWAPRPYGGLTPIHDSPYLTHQR